MASSLAAGQVYGFMAVRGTTATLKMFINLFAGARLRCRRGNCYRGKLPCPRHVHPVRAASWNCCDRYPCHSISAASSENSTSLVVAVGVICRGAKLFIRLLQQILGFRCMAVHIKLVRLLGG